MIEASVNRGGGLYAKQAGAFPNCTLRCKQTSSNLSYESALYNTKFVAKETKTQFILPNSLNKSAEKNRLDFGKYDILLRDIYEQILLSLKKYKLM